MYGRDGGQRERRCSCVGRCWEGRPLILVIFYLSGFAGLVYEVLFAKSLALVFGSTATAATTVLATYMGGMSLGSWLGGKLAARTRRPLVLYAACEAGVALACAVAPFAVGGLRAVYVALAHGTEPGRPAVIALQVALGAALLLIPTLLMGATLPLLARELARRESGLGRVVGALYAANTLGAATGALATGYVLLQTLGVLRTTFVAVALNGAVAVAALHWNRRAGPLGTPLPAPEQMARAHSSPKSESALGWWVLGLGGAVTLALEGVATHLLAVVVGNSAYAFSAMLFCFLFGLGLGSPLGRAWLAQGRSVASGLGLAQALLAASVLGGVFAWSHVPMGFELLGGLPVHLGFAAREAIRLAACALLLVPPALFIGASYPLAMEAVGSAGSEIGRMRMLGRAAAVNTLGNVGGALVGNFVLLPRAGSLHALQVLGALSLGLAAFACVAANAEKPEGKAARTDRRRPVLGVAFGIVLLALQPKTFDLSALGAGSNVYFRAQGFGEVIDHAESASGGLTSVATDADDEGHVVKTLLTNGKFQGNDVLTGEVAAQVAFALVPLLHVEHRRSALVIGFGTGTTTRVVSDAGFAEVDVAELSGDVVTLADRHFATINDHVALRPSVHVHVTDGRNFLLLEPHTYDLVTVEISSIWFAGASSLYDAEFYGLVKPRLAPGGVLQQWLQLHHLAKEDYVAVLSSVTSVFRNVWLYEVGNQGLLVACDDDCAPAPSMLERIESTPALEKAVAATPGGAQGLLRRRILTPEGVERFLSAAGATPEKRKHFASTDDNLYLEYSTPRGNVRDYEETFRANMAGFMAFTPGSEIDGTHLARR